MWVGRSWREVTTAAVFPLYVPKHCLDLPRSVLSTFFRTEHSPVAALLHVRRPHLFVLFSNSPQISEQYFEVLHGWGSKRFLYTVEPLYCKIWHLANWGSRFLASFPADFATLRFVWRKYGRHAVSVRCLSGMPLLSLAFFQQLFFCSPRQLDSSFNHTSTDVISKMEGHKERDKAGEHMIDSKQG